MEVKDAIDKRKKIKVVRSFIQYPFSQLELEHEVIAEGKAGFTIRITTPKGHNRAIPFQGAIILNCLYDEADSKEVKQDKDNH